MIKFAEVDAWDIGRRDRQFRQEIAGVKKTTSDRTTVHDPSGFTLIELLVVLVVVGMVTSLLMPALQRARTDARLLACQNNLKQIGLALNNYHHAHSTLPPATITRFRIDPGLGTNNCFPREPAEGLENSYAPWTVMLLPFMRLTRMYNEADMTEKFTSNPVDGRGADVNHALFDEVIDIYRCPSDPHVEQWKPRLCYFAVAGGGPLHRCRATEDRQRGHDMRGVMFFNSKIRRRDIIDGTSNTFAVGESRYQTFNDADGKNYGWASSGNVSPQGGAGGTFATAIAPINSGAPGLNGVTEQSSHFGSYHAGGANFLNADGAVHLMSENMDMAVYRRLANRADGHVTIFEPLESLERHEEPHDFNRGRGRRPGPR